MYRPFDISVKKGEYILRGRESFKGGEYAKGEIIEKGEEYVKEKNKWRLYERGSTY